MGTEFRTAQCVAVELLSHVLHLSLYLFIYLFIYVNVIVI